MKVLATKIPNDVYEIFVSKAKEEGISVSELLRRIVYEYLGKPQVNHRFTLQGKLGELEKRIEELEKAIEKLSGNIVFWVNRK